MILGTNLEFCVSDLLCEKVDISEVFSIITYNINFSNSSMAENWWNNQLDPMTVHWSQGKNLLHLFDYDTVYNLIIELKDNGTIVTRDKINPSRAIEIQTMASSDHWYQINLREKDMEPAVKLAWDHYQLLAGLCK
ncbi:hypothetical protein N9E09_00645 [bacterium]|jgi:hypothetical protein|nr:hypothetical protein [bacterium]